MGSWMKIKSLVRSITLSAVFLVVNSGRAFAEDEITFTAGLSAGIRNVDFELNGTVLPSFIASAKDPGVPIVPIDGLDIEISFDETIYTLGFLAGINYQDLAASVLFEITPEEADVDIENSAQFSGDGIPPGPAYEERSSDLERVDVTLTLNYRVTSGLRVFTGFKYTEFELSANENSFYLGEKDQTYTEEGLFVGASYSWPIRDFGSFSILAGYAYLDAEFSEDNFDTGPDPDAEFLTTFGEYKFSGSATGWSSGAQWVGPLADHWLYNVSLKYQSFETDDNSVILPTYPSDPGLVASPSVQRNVSSEHTDTIFNVGVLYVF